MKHLEQRQDRLESSITEAKGTQDETKQEMTTLSNKVVSWQESSDKKQDEMLQMLRTLKSKVKYQGPRHIDISGHADGNLILT